MPEAGTLVKPPQTRQSKGLSMVHLTSGRRWGLGDRRVYVKTQIGYCSRPSWRLWRSTPTFACEDHALSACESLGLNTPRVLSFRSLDGVTELVLEEIPDALPLPKFCARFPPGRVERMMTELGSLVGKLHEGGWTHGSIGGAHVIVQTHADDRVWLIDFEKARPAFLERQLLRDLARFFRRSPYLSRPAVDAFFTGYRSARTSWSRSLDALAERVRKE
jgi:tRNA A-37 threonylcarbamoyl transferase component Bud32